LSTLAMSCRAMAETSAVVSSFGSSTGGRVIFGFFPGCGKGMSMRLIFQKFAGDATHFLQCARQQRRDLLVQFVHGKMVAADAHNSKSAMIWRNRGALDCVCASIC